MKTYVEGGLDYVRSDASAKGLMFVQMIATAIRMRLSEMIRDTDLKDMGIATDALPASEKIEAKQIPALPSPTEMV